MDKSKKRIVLEIVKSVIYVILGAVFGVLLCANVDYVIKIVGLIGIGGILILVLVLFIITREKTPAITENKAAKSPKKPSYVPEVKSSQVQSARMPGRQVQNNPLDRRPMSAEKKEQREKNRVPVSKIILINEEGHSLMEWSLDRKTSMIIGKSSEKEPVDIDLSGSAVAQMISKQHAVLNYTENGWYVDDIDSKNGTRVKKATQHAIMDVKLVGAIEVEVGDIIYIASTMLQLQ